jgi:hypothetical protein
MTRFSEHGRFVDGRLMMAWRVAGMTNLISGIPIFLAERDVMYRCTLFLYRSIAKY